MAKLNQELYLQNDEIMNRRSADMISDGSAMSAGENEKRLKK